MAMELRLNLRQTQRMIMTQSLQQAIGLLQLSRLELLQAVRQEMEENPILEEELVEEGSVSAEAPAEAPAEEGREEGEDRISDFDWESYLQDASDYRRGGPRGGGGPRSACRDLALWGTPSSFSYTSPRRIPRASGGPPRSSVISTRTGTWGSPWRSSKARRRPRSPPSKERSRWARAWFPPDGGCALWVG